MDRKFDKKLCSHRVKSNRELKISKTNSKDCGQCKLFEGIGNEM